MTERARLAEHDVLDVQRGADARRRVAGGGRDEQLARSRRLAQDPALATLLSATPPAKQRSREPLAAPGGPRELTTAPR